jgi:hypothetical protein
MMEPSTALTAREIQDLRALEVKSDDWARNLAAKNRRAERYARRMADKAGR